MSISLIRCLLAVLALSESFDVVASKDVAQLLGVKRPTIHRSLEMLQQKGLIHKEPYGDIHLTDAGREQAQRMERPARRFVAAVFKALWSAYRGKRAGSLRADERAERG